MPKKTILYVDVDDTLISECFEGSNSYDLRPGVITQLTVLARIFDAHWLTHRSEQDLIITWDGLFANRMMNMFTYSDWREIDNKNKAPYVLSKGNDFWWVEDHLSTGSLKDLGEAGLMDRYIPVDPKGLFGFSRACQVLFDRAGIKEADIKKAGGRMRWFREPLTADYFDWHYYE